jgi:hypothetical protein
MTPSKPAPKPLSLKDIRQIKGGVPVQSSVKAGLNFQKIEYGG